MSEGTGTQQPLWTDSMIHEWTDPIKETILIFSGDTKSCEMVSLADAEALAMEIRDEYQAALTAARAERDAALFTLMQHNPDALAGDVQEWVKQGKDELGALVAAAGEWEPIPGTVAWEIGGEIFTFRDGIAEGYSETGQVLCRRVAKSEGTK